MFTYFFFVSSSVLVLNRSLLNCYLFKLIHTIFHTYGIKYVCIITFYKMRISTKFVNYNNIQEITSKINTNKCFRSYIIYLLFITNRFYSLYWIYLNLNFFRIMILLDMLIHYVTMRYYNLIIGCHLSRYWISVSKLKMF